MFQQRIQRPPTGGASGTTELRRRVEGQKHLDKGTRTTTVRSAIAVDTAMQRAFRDKLPVRVIVYTSPIPTGEIPQGSNCACSPRLLGA